MGLTSFFFSLSLSHPLGFFGASFFHPHSGIYCYLITFFFPQGYSRLPALLWHWYLALPYIALFLFFPSIRLVRPFCSAQHLFRRIIAIVLCSRTSPFCFVVLPYAFSPLYVIYPTMGNRHHCGQ
jgi:hypothetical protein